jgi:hypothetical protein
MRVCRPGGRIGVACWTPEGFLGQLFRAVARHVPPVPGVQSPLLWGTDAHIQTLFEGATAIRHTVQQFAFRYRSPEHWIDGANQAGARGLVIPAEYLETVITK